MKSERLKKLESELYDLEQWFNLGLVPKKDIEKHKFEIDSIKKRVEEEKHRLQALKESGDFDEYTLPKRTPQTRQAYQEAHTMPGVEMDGEREMTDSGFETESETSYDTESTTVSEDDNEEKPTFVEDEDDPFSDKNRWKRGILEDPDSDSW